MKNDLLPCPFCGEMTEHYLKTVEPYYSDIEQGYKEFDVRRRDRPFDVGDTLILQQYIDGRLTGKEIRRKVKYILLDENFVKEGYCVLGLESTRHEPEPRVLTVEELIASQGEPVWWRDLSDTPYDETGCWMLVDLNNLPRPWYSYGKTWLAYDRQPKEA